MISLNEEGAGGVLRGFERKVGENAHQVALRLGSGWPRLGSLLCLAGCGLHLYLLPGPGLQEVSGANVGVRASLVLGSVGLVDII